MGPFKNDVTGGVGRRVRQIGDRKGKRRELASGDVTIKKLFRYFLLYPFLNNLIQLFEVIHAFFI